MHGVAHDPVLRSKLMALHEQGVSLTALSDEFGIARQVLSRWWQRYATDDLAGLAPKSRRPHASPTRISRGTVRRALQLREQRRSAVWIARELELGYGTVQRLLEAPGRESIAAARAPGTAPVRETAAG
jgi:transposase-like protein